ncbi:unnamed protein product [Musa hybrid cultivar]
MVNSSWARSHIDCLWKIPPLTKRVYPPCDTSSLQPIIFNFDVLFLYKTNFRELSFTRMLTLGKLVRSPVIVSVAQFRPEKAHSLQLEAFAQSVGILDQDMPRPKLQFVGSCRNKQDEESLQKLKERCRELNLDNFVEFCRDAANRPSDSKEYQRSTEGGNKKVLDQSNQHFGIRYMASGVVPIAHDSAGPKMDIILNEGGRKTGFLASNKEEYTEAILKVIKMPEAERLAIAAAARKNAQKFSEQKFFEEFKAAVQPFLAPKSSS